MSKSKYSPNLMASIEAAKPWDAIDKPDESYDVERKGDMVSIGLGFVPAFEVPRDTAIKLAALILKKAGCGVTLSTNCLTASWKKLGGTQDG